MLQPYTQLVGTVRIERPAAALATPRLRALLASRKARAYARAGNVLACERALNEAERSLDKATTGPTEPDWLYYFDGAELAAQAGSCWVDLRQPLRARPLIDNALNSMNPHYVRDRAIYHARSAKAYLHEQELESACHQLRTAAELAHQTGSGHAHKTIRTARLGFSPYKDEVVVRELDDHIQDYHGPSAPR